MDDATYQEAYVLALIKIVLPGEYEVTTAPVGLRGNHIRGIRTLDVFALLNATEEQKAAARAVVDAERKRREQWHEQQRAAELAAQPKVYPY